MRRLSSRNCSAILAFTLLVFQMSIPWTVRHFVTEDGPSHVYTAMVARSLVFRGDSPYESAYRMNGKIVPNWGGAIVAAVAGTVAGFGHAEQLLMSVAVCAGFFSFSYAIRAIAPQAPRWTPMANFLTHTWFLWLGFWSFYLGMVLLPLVAGYYIRHHAKFRRPNAAVLSAGLTGLFLTHLIPAAIAILTIGTLAGWVHVIVPVLGRTSFKGIGRHIGLVLLAMAPALVLAALFAAASREPVRFDPAIASAWRNFPMHVFSTADGRIGNQELLYPVVMCFIVLAMLAMRRAEWLSIRGGLAAAAVCIFVLYLIVPDAGLGGKETKIRVAWGVFVAGGMLACSVARLRRLQLPLSIYIFAFLFANLIYSTQAVWSYSRAVEDYLSATSHIPRGASIVRLRYPTPGLAAAYGFEGIARDPLFHADAYAAVRCRCIDLSDYQAANLIFPVIYNRVIQDAQRFGLWSLEGPEKDTSETLKWLRSSLPVHIDYVIVVADESSASAPGYEAVMSQLNTEMRLFSQSRFVRVYRRANLPDAGSGN